MINDQTCLRVKGALFLDPKLDCGAKYVTSPMCRGTGGTIRLTDYRRDTRNSSSIFVP